MAKISLRIFSLRNFAWMFSATGLAISAHLTALDVQHRVPLCGAPESCEIVLTSRYSHIGPLPVSALGMLFYLIAALLLNREMSGGKIAKTGGLAWSFIGLLTSAVLVYLAVFRIHAVCQWCLGSAICSALLFATWGQIFGQEPRPFAMGQRVTQGILTVFVAFLAFLLSFAELEPPASQLAVPYSRSALADRSISTQIPRGFHSIGQGPPAIIFFGDLGCPACQYWYPRFREACRKQGARLVYRHFFKHQSVWDVTVLSERVPKNDFWTFVDEAMREEHDGGADRGDLMARWEHQGLESSVKDAEDRIHTDSKLARSLGFEVTPTIVWIDANGVQAVMSPGRALDALVKGRASDSSPQPGKKVKSNRVASN